MERLATPYLELLWGVSKARQPRRIVGIAERNESEGLHGCTSGWWYKERFLNSIDAE
jgi:hypothetical protein